ncbi:diphthamide biosynthesis enzyme Dph2 [Candidatus Parvarchaeota archaeon]|nr:diphthamide biosynthesis enzyme Dph2 [Candidatus Parvarchaeota archaeon]
MKILLQFPEGLKTKAREICASLESSGNAVFISAAPCFGACDLALEEARLLKVDKLMHFGHAEFHKVKGEKFEIEYIQFPVDANLEILKNRESLALISQYKTVGLVTTVNHLHQLGDMKKILEAAGHKVQVGMGGQHVRHEGQILGCDTYAANRLQGKCDCLAYVGGGLFHPLGVDAKIPFFVFDPFSGRAYRINEQIEKLRKRKKGMLLACTQPNVKNFGIIVSTKNGQYNIAGAQKVKADLEGLGKKGFILVANFIDPIALQDFNFFDAYVNTACPRIPEDYERYGGKPVIDIIDFKELKKLLSA